MYEHKILCFLEYEEDDEDDDDEEKWKKWIFYPNCQKLQPRPSEDDGEIFADISDETMTKTLYVCTVTIKSFSSVPI